MPQIITKETALRGWHEEIFVTPDESDAFDLEKSIASTFPLLLKITKKKFSNLERHYGLRLQLRVFIKLRKFSFEQQRYIEVKQWFPSDSAKCFDLLHIKKRIQEMVSQCLARYDTFVHTGSGWILKRVEKFSLALMRFKLFSGGCNKSVLPAKLRKSKAIISVPQSDSNMCFVYAIAIALLRKSRNPSRNCKEYQQLVQILPSVLKHFPVTVKDVIKLEKTSPFSFNIYGFEKVLFPYYITDQIKLNHFNFLLHKDHYYVITDLGPLVRSHTQNNSRKCFVCNYCLTYFNTRKKLKHHSEMCFGKGRPIEMPGEKDKIMSFKSFSHLLPASFVIYADLESAISNKVANLDSTKQISKQPHQAISFGTLTVCRDAPEFSSESPRLYTGPNCIAEFFEHLKKEMDRINEILSVENKPLKMSLEDNMSFQSQNRCHFCLREFKKYPYLYKVRDHCHLSGKFRFALCSRCNLTFAKTSPKIMIILHGLCNYDSHFIIDKLYKYSDKFLKVIPRTGEKYLSFSVGDLVFKDSYQFLTESLSNLAKNLKNKGLAYFNNVNRYILNKEWKCRMLQKGIFPYNYIKDLTVLEEKSLPAKEMFYNDLTNEHISDENYNFAQNMWKLFKCQTLKDYLHMYLLADILLLADCFENFRSNCIEDYELDPIHYYSNAHFTFDAFLRFSGVELELLTDSNMYLFFSKGIRGGLSMVSSERYVQANNKYLDSFNSQIESTYLMYLDCNNLYGKAMLQYLPYKDFKWEKPTTSLINEILNTPSDAERGFVLEVSFIYPQKLHDLHSDYPLAPEKKIITKDMLSPFALEALERDNLKLNKAEKLLATLHNKHRYVLHYRVFQLYVQLGLEIQHIHHIISFKQAPIMKEYIELNSKKRAESTNNFDSDFYKLLCNSLFGKTMERPENKSKVKLVNRVETYEKYVSKLNFKNCKIINPQLVGLELSYPSLKINKPFYLGMVILDLAKFFMYDFHYNVIKPFFGSKINLLYTDTDSFIYKIKTEDVYSDLAKFPSGYFDFSNYDSSHGLYSAQFKKVPGLFKDECKGKIIKSFVGLRSKMYCLKVKENDKEEMKEIKIAKGVKKNVIDKNLSFQDYVNCLLKYNQMEHDFKTIRSVNHDVFTSHQRKITLSPYDDKRFLLDYNKSVAYGFKNVC